MHKTDVYRQELSKGRDWIYLDKQSLVDFF